MDYSDAIRRILWYVLAGTKGGPTRVKILMLLRERPYNINQLSSTLKMDYKTILHHIKILEENKIIYSDEKKYGTIYFISQVINQNMQTFEEISRKIREK